MVSADNAVQPGAAMGYTFRRPRQNAQRKTVAVSEAFNGKVAHTDVSPPKTEIVTDFAGNDFPGFLIFGNLLHQKELDWAS